MTDRSGTVVWAAYYRPFGEAVIVTETVKNNFRFPGQYYDSETGLHYNYHRYYDPSTGRYLTPDPSHSLGNGVPFYLFSLILSPQEFHHYGYAQNNPIVFMDANGLISVSGCCGDKESGIRTGASNACSSVSSTITDAKLKACMEKRCREAKINCETCKDNRDLGSNTWYLWTIPSKTISVCTNNPHLLNKLENVLLHEWAHSCGWDHYQGGGVPGQNGFI